MDYSGLPFVFHPAPKGPTPLALIGGSGTPKTSDNSQISEYSVLQNAFFDWYQCSLSVAVPEIVSQLADFYGAVTRPGKPQPPYLRCMEFVPLGTKKNDKSVVPFCTLHYGGVNERSMIRASSDNAVVFAEFVRKTWPEHSVSRLDVALDFQEGPDFFNDMSSWLIDYAKENRLKTAFAGDWASGESGRTLYVGSRKSAVFIRLYEKGMEQLAKGNADAPVDWVRFEAEIKPANKDAKRRMAAVEPRNCFGASLVLRAFAELLGDKYEPIKVGTVWKQTDFDRSFQHMCYQYGDVLKKALELCGDDKAACAAMIFDTIKSEEEKRAGIRSQIKEYASRDLGRSYVTGPSVSVPPPADPPLPSLLTPAFLRQYPELLRGQEYRRVSKADVLPLLLQR